MRIIYFTAADSPHDQRFLSALGSTQHQVYALRQHPCDPAPISGVTELDWLNGFPDWGHWPGWEQGVAQLQGLLADIQPDLVHAGPVQGPAFITALSGFHPLVTMSWGSDLLIDAHRSPWMRFATRSTLAETEIFIGDCQTVAAEAQSFGFPSERIVRFPWGVDLDRFSPQEGRDSGQVIRKSLGWDDKFVIFCNRAWDRLHGVDILAKAFLLAAQENPAIRLLLMGAGPLAESIKDTLEPVRKKVTFPGRVGSEVLPAFYCAADLFISPSHSDGSSVSLLEALACGRPVLVSDIPSNREWVQAGKVGGLFRDGDVVSLCDQILRLVSDPHLSRYSENARLLAETRADWDKSFLKLMIAYKRAIQ